MAVTVHDLYTHDFEMSKDRCIIYVSSPHVVTVVLSVSSTLGCNGLTTSSIYHVCMQESNSATLMCTVLCKADRGRANQAVSAKQEPERTVPC